MDRKIGDKVRIKEKLSKDSYGFVDIMNKFLGKETTICKISGISYQLVGCDNWWWTDEMLEDVVTKEVKCMDISKLAKELTREQFLKEYAHDKGCPSEHGIINDEGDCGEIGCNDCWNKVVKYIQFKGEEDIPKQNNKLNIKELAKTMTRVEFLEQIDKNEGLNNDCVRYTNINVPREMFEGFNCCPDANCKKCFEIAIKDILFKGDRVIKKDSNPFYNGEKVATIIKIEKSICGDYDSIWLNTDSWVREGDIELYEEEEVEPNSNYKYIFDINEYKSKDIAINCETEEEAEKFFEILIMNGIDKSDIDIMRQCYFYYGMKTCYNFDYNKMLYGDISYYEQEKYLVYKFSDVDFGNVWDKESINEVALNKVKEFDITKCKYITLNELLSNRGFKTGDILLDDEGYVGILLDNKVIYINTACQEKLNTKAYYKFIPIEKIKGIPYFAKDLSHFMDTKEYKYLEEYVISIQEQTKQVTICKINHTSDSDKLKEFLN